MNQINCGYNVHMVFYCWYDNDDYFVNIISEMKIEFEKSQQCLFIILFSHALKSCYASTKQQHE